MFDIYGVPPFNEQERKLTSRKTKEEAVTYANELTSHGYSNLRVVDTSSTPGKLEPQVEVVKVEPAPAEQA